MRNVLRLAGLFVFLAVLPRASAADLTGTWKGAFDFNSSSVPLTFHLTAAGNAVTGTVEGLPTTPAEIRDGKMDGDTVTFWVATEYDGQPYKLVYKGKVSAGQIEFSFGTEDGAWSTELTAKKSEEPAVKPAAPELTGTWKGAFSFEGNDMPLTFNLKSSGNTVTGTVEGLPNTPAEIRDGKVDGDAVTFWVATEYQGQTYKLVYKGKVVAGQIKFAFGTEDGSWGAELAVTKSL
jgi:hypothetical protein